MTKVATTPGALKAVGGLLIAYASISLLPIILVILVPLILWASMGVTIPDQMTQLQIFYYTMDDEGLILIRSLTALGILFVFTNLIFSYLMMTYGMGILKNRLTKSPPIWIPIVILVSIIIPFNLNFWLIKIIFGIVLIVFMTRDETKRYYLWYHGKPLPDLEEKKRIMGYNKVYSEPSPYAFNKPLR